MWWEFHRLLELTPEQLVDEEDPIGLLEPVGPLDERRRASRPGATAFPAQDYDLGRGEVYDPANKQARPDDSPFSWEVGDGRRGRSRGPDRRLPADASPNRIHARSSRCDWVRTRTTRRRCSSSASGSPTTGSRRPAEPGRRATCCSGCRRGSAWLDEELCRRGRDGPRRGPPARARARPHDAADPGPAGVGQDLHRRADDLLAARRREAGRDHGDEPQGHRQPARRRSSRPRRSRGVDVRAVQRGDAGAGARRRRVDRGKDAARCPGPARRRSGEPGRRDVVAVGVGEDDRTPSTSCSSTRPARSRSPTSSRSRARRDSLVLLGDPQQLDQPLQGSHPPGADRSALAHILGRDATMPPTRGLFLETTWRLHPGPVRLHLGGVLRRPARARAAPRRPARRRRPRARRRHRARGCSTCRRSAPTTSRPTRRTRSRRSPARSWRAGQLGGRGGRRRARSAGTTS